MKTCAHLSEAQRWAAQGCNGNAPRALQAHAADCGICAEFIATVKLGRQLGQSLPALSLSHARHAAMREELVSHSRFVATQARETRRAHWGLRLLAAAFITTGAAAAARHVVLAPARSITSAVGVSAAPASASAGMEAQPWSRLGSRPLVQLPLWAPNSVGSLQNPAHLLPSNADRSRSPSAPTSQSSSSLDDAGFVQAWTLLRNNKPAAAARQFDALLDSRSLDSARRADILYWSAQSHRQAGEAGAAIERASQLLRQFSSAPHASDAALILGEYALASDQFDRAKQYLSQAARSERSVVRDRAERGLRALQQKQGR